MKNYKLSIYLMLLSFCYCSCQSSESSLKEIRQIVSSGKLTNFSSSEWKRCMKLIKITDASYRKIAIACIYKYILDNKIDPLVVKQSLTSLELNTFDELLLNGPGCVEDVRILLTVAK
jgi:hypothetical protein